MLDNLEALQEQQQADDFERADAACRLHAAIVAGLDGLEAEAASAGASGLQQQPQKGGGGGGSGSGSGMAGVQRAKQQLFNQRGTAVPGGPLQGAGQTPHPHHPLVVVGVAGSHALSLDDGLARCFTAAKVGAEQGECRLSRRQALFGYPKCVCIYRRASFMLPCSIAQRWIPGPSVTTVPAACNNCAITS